VYKGVRIDYRGEDVTADTFLAVLEGRAAAVANKGSGRVIASGPNDRVFVFYSDHGSAGVLGMPSGAFLYADQLLGALNRKAAHHGFKEMVL
jgi:legumain